MTVRFSTRIEVSKPSNLLDALADETSISKLRLKECLTKGGVWLKRPGRKERRVRRAKHLLKAGDIVHIYYDAAILGARVAEPEQIFRSPTYSVWNKPAGMLSQGSRYGDHCSLLRYLEKQQGIAQPYLVHRLDREAHGLMVVAHDKKAATMLSAIFREREVTKKYLAWCHGRVGAPGNEQTISAPLDAKNARTDFRVRAYNDKQDISLLDIDLFTGRYHQVRRHLLGLGHPLVGDRKYGAQTDDKELQLVAYLLRFKCPSTHQDVTFTLADTALSPPVWPVEEWQR